MPSILFLYHILHPSLLSFFFFFNDTATTEIYTLSLHDALPICHDWAVQDTKYGKLSIEPFESGFALTVGIAYRRALRSEEHTSELQSPCNLVCRLLLEKKKKALRYYLQLIK